MTGTATSSSSSSQNTVLATYSDSTIQEVQKRFDNQCEIAHLTITDSSTNQISEIAGHDAKHAYLKIASGALTDEFVNLLQSKLLGCKQLKKVRIKLVGNIENDAINRLLSAIFRANLQTLVDVSLELDLDDKAITGIKLSDTTLEAIRDNSFVTRLSIPSDKQPLVRQVSAYNSRMLPKWFGISGEASNWAVWPAVVCLVTGFGVFGGFKAAVAFALSIGIGAGFEGVLPALLGAFFVAVVTLLPFYVIQAYINRRDYRLSHGFFRSPWQDATKALVSLTLSSQQVARANALIAALNQRDPSLMIPTLKGSAAAMQTMSLTRQHAAAVTQLLQLAQCADMADSPTFCTFSAFKLAKKIAHASGYGSAANEKTTSFPALEAVEAVAKFDPAASLKYISIRAIARSIHPFRNLFSNRYVFRTYYDSRYEHFSSHVVYFDANAAAQQIAENKVSIADVVVDSSSIETIAIACNGNLSLAALTLRFTKNITHEDAKYIAQIIHRNAPHLRMLNLPDAHYEQGAFEVIQNALRLNSAITEFSCSKTDAVTRATIDKTLNRNQRMLNYPSLGMSVFYGVVIGLMVGVLASTPFVMALIATPWFLPVFFGAGVGVAIVGGFLAVAIAVGLGMRVRNASLEWRDLQREEIAQQKQVDVVMTVAQYQRSMKGVLSSAEKISASLRPGTAQIVASIAASKASSDTTKTSEATGNLIQQQDTEKSSRHILRCDTKENVTHDQIKTLNSDTKLQMKLSSPRVGFFSSVCRVNALADQLKDRVESESKLKQEVLEAHAESYDTYWVTKPAHTASIGG